VQRTLALLQRLAEHLASAGPDRQARDAASDVLRYFDMAAPAHHEDEERHVLPRLRALGHTELADRLHADHERMHAGWQALRTQLLALRDQAARPDCSAWPDFVALYGEHIELEEGQAFPLSAAACGTDECAQMGAEMAARRGAARAS
jgi:hemerythrin-like domain-containing protein